MQDLEMKQKIAKEIMELMDAEEGEQLKKHPKLMAASVQVEKAPEALEAEKEVSAVESEEPELSPDMIQKLLEMMEAQKA